MFRFMLAKLKHKKWMLLCLLIGNILLVAVSSGYLVYQSASFERMFVKEFDRKWEKTGKWPFMLRTSAWTVTPEATENLYLQTEKMIMELDLPVKESHMNRNIRSDVAMAAFKDSTFPSIGIFKYVSAAFAVDVLRPFPSLPIKNAVPSLKEKLS